MYVEPHPCIKQLPVRFVGLSVLSQLHVYVCLVGNSASHACTGRISASTRPHQLRWGDQKCLLYTFIPINALLALHMYTHCSGIAVSVEPTLE